ncbi:MAG: serine/threonine protein kinase [Myxococcaceae bacterium]|nr:serine/threonine protein kinase [Myxococcaceae bacterium]
MTPPDGPEARYSLHLEARGIDARSLGADDDGTLTRPSKPTTLDRLSLPLVTVSAGDASSAADFTTGRVLGEGGMGKVVVATQRALGREVALKFLRDSPEDASRAAELLREGVVTGQLEHPNIVPVHLLARTDDGQPFFVMKRIEGTPWSTLLADPAALADFPRAGAKPPLVFHLEVLLEVCDAVAFAHSRGVLHRDLKPANVMLGAFGEVYLLDWGIALALDERPALPRASDERGLAGTATYMAPEMAAAEGGLTERTDVYLLGAILYEVLTGRPPHAGATLVQQLSRAFEAAPPVFPADVPSELAALCRRALARRPDERFPSARALHEALRDALARRDAFVLQAESRERLVALEALVAAPGADAVQVQQAFSECRFGFQQALKRYPGFAEAEAGLERALVAMTSHELALGPAAAARAFASQLRRPRPELLARLEAAEAQAAAQAERVRRLETFAKDADLDTAVMQRGALALAVALVWALISLGAGALVRRGAVTFGHREALWAMSLYGVMSLGLAESVKRAVALNKAQRRLLRGNLVALSAFIGFWALTWWLGVDFHASLVTFMFLVSALWAVAAALFDARGLTMGVAFLVGTAVAAARPGWAFEVFGFSTLLGFSALGVAWRHWRGAGS